MKKTYILYMLLSSFLFSTSQATSQIKCLRTLSEINHQDLKRLDASVYAPSKDGKGFYLYSDASAVFCEYPSKKNLRSENYILGFTTKDGKKEHLRLSAGSNQVQTYLPSTFKDSVLLTTSVKCETKNDSDAKNLLLNELKSNISTSFSDFERRTKGRDNDSAMYPGNYAEKRSAEYVRALNSCSNIPELKSEIAKEVQKFPYNPYKTNTSVEKGIESAK